MVFFPDGKTLVSFGAFSIRYYALCILLGVVVSYILAWRSLKKKGYPKAVVDDLYLGCFLLGIVGARLWFCLLYDPAYYFSNPLHILPFQEGSLGIQGLAIQGGLMAGVAFALGYCHHKKLSFLRVADSILPTVLVAQAIGRWGNFFNQEAFGPVVTENFYAYFPSFIKQGMWIEGAYRFPSFLLESVLNLLAFFLIVVVLHKLVKPRRGNGVYGYAFFYGLIRFITEAGRTDSLMFAGLKMAQLLSIGTFLFGLLGYLGVWNKLMKKEKPLLLFDLDGTLLDTEPAILETYRHLFEKYRTVEEFDREKQLAVLGPPLSKMFKIYFPEQDTEALIKEYREYNFKIHPDFVKPMEHTQELLEYLKNQGYEMGIVSTKFSDGVEYGLKLFHLETYFTHIIGQEKVKKGKPDPEGIFTACAAFGRGHDSCVYVGDSATDIEAAHRAGVYSIGYYFNEERREKLEAAKPNQCVDDLLEIEEILKGDHAWTNTMM